MHPVAFERESSANEAPLGGAVVAGERDLRLDDGDRRGFTSSSSRSSPSCFWRLRFSPGRVPTHFVRAAPRASFCGRGSGSRFGRPSRSSRCPPLSWRGSRLTPQTYGPAPSRHSISRGPGGVTLSVGPGSDARAGAPWRGVRARVPQRIANRRAPGRGRLPGAGHLRHGRCPCARGGDSPRPWRGQGFRDLTRRATIRVPAMWHRSSTRTVLAGYVNIGLALVLGQLFAPRSLWPRSILAALAVALVGFEVWVASRGGVIGTALAVVLVGWMSRSATPERTSTARALVLPGVLVVAGIGMIVLSASDQATGELATTELSKLDFIRETFRIVPAFPVFGVGRGAFESVFPAYRGDVTHMVYTHPGEPRVPVGHGVGGSFPRVSRWSRCSSR